MLAHVRPVSTPIKGHHHKTVTHPWPSSARILASKRASEMDLLVIIEYVMDRCHGECRHRRFVARVYSRCGPRVRRGCSSEAAEDFSLPYGSNTCSPERIRFV